MKSIVALVVLFFLGLTAFGQLSLQSGEQYLQGITMKKVVVSYDDHTVWALSMSGQVYIKRNTEPDFSLYNLMVGEVVDDLSGYAETEMYFLIKPKKLILIKNNVKTELVFPTSVSSIRDIAVVLDATKGPHLAQLNSNNVLFKDRLAVATNEYLYMILRGETAPNKLDIYGQPNFDIKDFSITRTGIKSVEFKGRFSSSGRCWGWESDYSVIKTRGQATFVSVIPERAPYSAIRCSLFDYSSQWSSDYAFDFWGTAQGLYVKRFGGCDDVNPIKTAISGEAINSLDAIVMLSAMQKNTFVLAATDNGLHYTPDRIYNDVNSNADVNRVNFVAFAPLLGLKVNTLTIDFTDFVPLLLSVYPNYYACEKVIWLATDVGVKKLYAFFDGEEFNDKQMNGFYANKSSQLLNGNEAHFNFCNGETVEISSPIPENLAGPILVQWYKNDVEIPELLGKVKATFNEEGRYRAQVTALCENVRMKSMDFVIKLNSAPEIIFNYPAVINLCEGQTQELHTVNKTGYKYKWFKNGSELSGETNHNYIVSKSGMYKIAVSNCAGVYISSSEVQINIPILTKPRITANQSSYCEGEVPELSIHNPENHKVKWYFNGIEQTGLVDKEMIQAPKEGNYKAVFIADLGCEKASDIFDLAIHKKPEIVISKHPDRLLCYNESATLAVPSQAGYRYTWSNGANTASINVVKSGTFTVTVTNEYGCSNISDAVEVIINAQINLNRPPESKLCTFTGEEITLVADQGYVSYVWNGVRTASNTMKVRAPGNYNLEITDAMGCKASIVFSVIAWCKELVVANAFSPNSDGNNDVWRVGGLEFDPQASLQIYNRFGNLVFKTTGSSAQWDGEIDGNEAPAGIYYYMIKSRQSRVPLKGSITLIR